MDIFDYVTVAVSFVLGLAVAFMLESVVKSFHERKRCRLDWLPYVWVACVLVQQFQFWWALYGVHTITQISVTVFTGLLFLSGLLFLAGAMVLPSREVEYPEDLWEYFRSDGSWAIAALAVYNAVAVLINIALFDTPPLVLGNVLNLAMCAVALPIVVLRDRRTLIVLTFVYIVVLAAATVVNTPGSY